MKRLITLLMIAFSSYSFAQGIGTVKLMNYEAKQYMKKQEEQQKQKVDTLEVAIKKAAEKAKLKAKVKENKVPFYYYGREGKIMVLSDLTQRAIKNKKESKKQFKKKEKQDTVQKVNWFRIIFLNDRYPGETDKEYRERLNSLGLPANQPFK